MNSFSKCCLYKIENLEKLSNVYLWAQTGKVISENKAITTFRVKKRFVLRHTLGVPKIK